jgi:hypothetical protein
MSLLQGQRGHQAAIDEKTGSGLLRVDAARRAAVDRQGGGAVQSGGLCGEFAGG